MARSCTFCSDFSCVYVARDLGYKLNLSVTQQASPCLGCPPFPAQFFLTLGVNSAFWCLSLAPSCLLSRLWFCFFLLGTRIALFALENTTFSRVARLLLHGFAGPQGICRLADSNLSLSLSLSEAFLESYFLWAKMAVFPVISPPARQCHLSLLREVWYVYP